jgi:hypothetical protein
MVTSPKRLRIALCAAALVAMPVAASAANFTTTSDACGEGCTTISIVGPILVNDDDQFVRLIKNQKIDKALVQLDSPGGYIPPMVAIGDQIHNAGFWTYVPPGALCTSACASIWLAGRKRFLAPNGYLGFHSSGHTVDGRRLPSPAGDALVLAYFHRLALRDDAIAYFFAASTFDMSYVTLRKMRQLGIDCDSFPPPMVALASKPVPTTTFKGPKPQVDNAPNETIVPKTEPEPVPIKPAEPVPVRVEPEPAPFFMANWEILGIKVLVTGLPVFIIGAVIFMIVVAMALLERGGAEPVGRAHGIMAIEATLQAQAIGRKAVEEALRPKRKSPWARVL